MRNWSRKSGGRALLESWPVVIFLGLVLLFFAWAVFGLLRRMEVTRENKNIAREKAQELALRKEQLTADIDKLNTPEGQEASIREKFGLAKEGEKAIVIIEDPNAGRAQAEDEGGFFSFFKNLFK